MIKIKTGKEVLTEQDVQNLITSTILCHKNNFRKDEIITKVKKRLKGSKVQLDDCQIKKCISNTLDTLECNGVFKVRDGVYNKKEMIIW